MKRRVVGMSLAVAASALLAQTQTVAVVNAAKSGVAFDAGADVRVRYEYKDNWMKKNSLAIDPKYEDYYRARSRVWGKATYGDDLGEYVRLGNEFRNYGNSTASNRKNEFPDELFIDNAYLDFNDLGERVDLRVGRQDVKEGAGRVISDGTPGDGSRSTYFDAVLATVKVLEKSDVDLMGTWNRFRDDWTLGSPHDIYDLTKLRTGSPYSRMEERGVMAYLHYNEVSDFPMEFYWIWKQETRFFDRNTRIPGRDFHTLGARLMPKLTEKLSAEVEGAAQLGQVNGGPGFEDRDIFAYMGYAGLTYSEKAVFGKPKVTGAVLYLSGDKQSYYNTRNGGTDSSWNPVFNRTTWFSELCSNMFDQYRWSNLIYPHVEAGVEPLSKHRVKLQTGPLFADEKDLGATDTYRGYFTQLRYDFPLLSKMFGQRGELSGAVVGESLYYGDYYQHDAANENAAYWLRFELNGKF